MAWVVVITPVLGVVTAGALIWGFEVSTLDLVMLAVMYVASVIGVEVGFHRHFSHRAFQATPAVRAALAILGSTAAQGPVLFWAAIHRVHHASSDGPGDPHTPCTQRDGPAARLKGLWHAHVGWLLRPEPIDFAARTPDLLRDRLIFRLHRLYPLWVLLGLAAPAALGGMLTGTWMGCVTGFVWGGLVRLFLVQHATWSVNSLCHAFGSRPFDTRDQSANNAWLVPTSLGGCWHNNHHAFPRSARNDFWWWQLDPCGWLIGILEITGLVWDVRTPSRRQLAARLKSSPHGRHEVST